MQVTSILPRLNSRFTNCKKTYEEEQIILSRWKVCSTENDKTDKKYQLPYGEATQTKLFSAKIKIDQSNKKRVKSEIHVKKSLWLAFKLTANKISK